MKHNYNIWQSKIDSTTCDQIVNVCKQYPEIDAKTFGGDTNLDHIRKSTLRWVHDEGINKMLMWHATRANRESFGVDISYIPDIQFTEYVASNSGFYTWHSDLDTTKSFEFDRKLSIIIQLSEADSYEGGDFLFDQFTLDKERVRECGTVIVFPSFMIHCVTPVTKGIRNSLVTWVEGPAWR